MSRQDLPNGLYSKEELFRYCMLVFVLTALLIAGASKAYYDKKNICPACVPENCEINAEFRLCAQVYNSSWWDTEKIDKLMWGDDVTMQLHRGDDITMRKTSFLNLTKSSFVLVECRP